MVNQGKIDLSGVEILVLDEADRMLDMGFIHDVKKVLAKLPSKRQNLLFSATFSQDITNLAGGAYCITLSALKSRHRIRPLSVLNNVCSAFNRH